MKSDNETNGKSDFHERRDLPTGALVGIVIASAIVAVVVAIAICRYNNKR